MIINFRANCLILDEFYRRLDDLEKGFFLDHLLYIYHILSSAKQTKTGRFIHIFWMDFSFVKNSHNCSQFGLIFIYT